jgi:hypothetical protein
MKTCRTLAIVALGALVTLGAPPAGAATKCDLSFHLEGWSAFYKTAHGGGRVTCSNGQVRNVVIRTTGGGPTVGRSSLRGRGDFSPVGDIREIYGNYANAEAHAGIVRSSTAQVVTKGTVSLAFAGKGEGIDLGIAFGKFTIAPAGHRARRHHR